MAERGKIFKEAPILAPNRSWFDMSFDNELSCNIGEIIPTMCMECLPGDVIHQKSSHFGRLMPLVSPVMGKMNVFSYHFFVRMRDIWTQFDKFITNNDQRKPWQQQTSFVAPQMPYYKLRDLLYDSFLSPQSPSLYNAVSGTFHTDLEDKCYKLILWYDSTDSKWKYYFQKHMPSWQVGSGPQFVFFFTPNRDEVDEINHRFKAKPNPFGESSLFDYLGVHIGDVLRKQFYDNQNLTAPIISWMEAAKTVAPDNYENIFDGAIPEIYTPQTFSPNSPYFTGQAEQAIEYCGAYTAVTTLKQFLTTHLVQAVFYTNGDTTQGAVTVGATDMKGTSEGTGYSSIDLTVSGHDDEISSLPFRAYRFIYDEYFRDQNYIAVNPHTNFARDGRDDKFTAGETDDEQYEYFNLCRKAWEHDPYTTALPSAQRGDAVRFLPDSRVSSVYKSGDPDFVGQGRSIMTAGNPNVVSTDLGASTLANTASGGHVELTVDLSAATIENFRWANAMQKYLERKARTGGRYYEYLIGIWNREVEDAKLNRPIYISGSKSPVQISEVVQTSSTNISTEQPLGDLAGRGITIGEDNHIEYVAPDYGFFIEVCVVCPRVQYQQGLKPMFSRMNYLDYPLPDFAQLGEEYIKVKELFYEADSTNDDVAFGYTPRYSSWKYNRDEVHGQLKSSLDHWTLARKFDSAPIAGRKFLEVDPTYRQFAVTNKFTDHIILTMWHDIQVNRALPEYGVPVL